MYNNILPEKCKANLSIFFQKFNKVLFAFIDFNFGQTFSSIKFG